MATTFDIIVVGAGMAGVSVAAELSCTARVVLLEAESQPGYHATGRSAAAFIPSYGGASPALNALTRASQPFLSSTPGQFADVPLLRQRGMLTIYDQQSPDNPAELADDLKSLISGEVSVMGKHEIKERIPLVRDGWNRAVFEHDVFDIDVHALLQAYLRQCRRASVTLVQNAEAQRIERRGQDWFVQAAGEEYLAPVLVNAAGAWADLVAERAGVHPLGLQPLRRTAALIKLPDGVDASNWPLMFAADGSFYLKPDAGLLLASPADEHPSIACDVQPEEFDIAYAAHYAQELLDITVERVAASWAGLRTFAKDRVPVVGFDAEQAGFFWLVGQGGHGIQIAPATAQLAASLITQSRIPNSLVDVGFNTDWVSPCRFGEPGMGGGPTVRHAHSVGVG